MSISYSLPFSKIRRSANESPYQPFSNFCDDPEDDAKSHYSQVDINVSHPIKLTRIAFRSLLSKNKKGTILIISSIAGLQGSYAAPLYCATKWAVIGLVRSLKDADANEGLRVMAICPGQVGLFLILSCIRFRMMHSSLQWLWTETSENQADYYI